MFEKKNHRFFASFGEKNMEGTTHFKIDEKDWTYYSFVLFSFVIFFHDCIQYGNSRLLIFPSKSQYLIEQDWLVFNLSQIDVLCVASLNMRWWWRKWCYIETYIHACMCVRLCVSVCVRACVCLYALYLQHQLQHNGCKHVERQTWCYTQSLYDNASLVPLPPPAATPVFQSVIKSMTK